jgi:hypothetical protein
MIIVLINWRIVPEKEASFVEFWRSTLKLEGAEGLIGEFLSKVEKESFYEKVTWGMEPSEQEADKSFWNALSYVSFVNVGLWASLEQFDFAVGKLMNTDPRAMNEFEAAPRRRAVLTPAAWRMGSSAIPAHSSDGVKP